MKSISVKTFYILMMMIAFFSEAYLFLNFYEKSKSSISELLTQNLQSDILNIKYFLNKNLSSNNINNLLAYLDNASQASVLINDMHIINDSDVIIYSTDKTFNNNIHNCTNISDINKKNIFKTKCYSFDIKLYNGLHPYYYESRISINHSYIENLLTKHILIYITYYLIFLFIIMLFLWKFLKKMIINPLEELRRYAYSGKEEPKMFFIQEFETIRNSLSITLNRLKREQDELYKLSTHDPLSGLYNRLSLMEKLEWLISNNERTNNKFALLFLDLDNFKNINDSMGHHFGDKVLQHISKILLEIVRENDIVSRIGGDEFVIVLPDLTQETVVFELADRLIHKLSLPVVMQDYKYQITASIGITIYPRDGTDANTILKNADIAMYKSKELGKNKYHFFTNSLNQIVHEKIHMQRLMIDALQNNHFKLYYQPKVDIKTDKILSCEALIRLIDPIEGLIPPDKFIPFAEENNFIIPIGTWVIKESIKQIKEWKNTELDNIIVSINISAKQFTDLNLIKLLKEETQKIDIKKLDIELTESVLMTDFKQKLKTINEIKDLGITLSLDDFGTGYSSLSYLKSIPFDTIKIDKSFIDDVLKDEKEKSFVLMIINIASLLGLKVVAEGVETQAQREFLEEVGCDIYQGYLCSKPLPVKEFTKLIISRGKNSNVI